MNQLPLVIPGTRPAVNVRHEGMNIDTPEGMAAAVAQQEQMISTICDGGRWVVPRTGSIYMLDQKNKCVKRVLGLVREPDIARVFRAMGWTVVDNEEEL